MFGKSYETGLWILPTRADSPADERMNTAQKESVGEGNAGHLRPTDSLSSYIGTCLPVGLLRHELHVKLMIEEAECPQYLQTYLLFSSPL